VAHASGNYDPVWFKALATTPSAKKAVKMSSNAKVQPPIFTDIKINRFTSYATPSLEEIADWHVIDQLLESDWNRPLVKILRFVVDRNGMDDLPFGPGIDETGTEIALPEGPDTEPLFGVVDLRTALRPLEKTTAG